jgi:hypothetical protein
MCEHKVERLNPITGDPKQIVLMCKKCGEKATHNLVTGETR